MEGVQHFSDAAHVKEEVQVTTDCVCAMGGGSGFVVGSACLAAFSLMHSSVLGERWYQFWCT